MPNDADIPYLTTAQMVAVDRAMIADFAIDLSRMMEKAGRHLANLAVSRFLAGEPGRKSVVVLAGSGGNGGGALVAARHLVNRGCAVHVVLGSARDRYLGVIGQQLSLLQGLPVAIDPPAAAANRDTPDLIIDGMIGYSLAGAPKGDIAGLITWANNNAAPILALDMPTGVDATTGQVFDPAVRAAATMTLALPKEGLCADQAREHIGELYLADIGVPPELYGRPPLNLAVGPIFAKADIIRLR